MSSDEQEGQVKIMQAMLTELAMSRKDIARKAFEAGKRMQVDNPLKIDTFEQWWALYELEHAEAYE